MCLSIYGMVLSTITLTLNLTLASLGMLGQVLCLGLLGLVLALGLLAQPSP